MSKKAIIYIAMQIDCTDELYDRILDKDKAKEIVLKNCFRNNSRKVIGAVAKPIHGERVKQPWIKSFLQKLFML